MRRLVRLAAFTGLVATAATAWACLGVEYHKVAALPGSGGGGGGGACVPLAETAPDDCEPALLADAANCCVKGHSCQGGSCKEGRCQPVTVADNDQETVDVVVVADRVVWSSGYDGRIFSIPLGGGPIEQVVADPESYTTALATEGERAYWVEFNGAKVYSVDPVAGSSSLVLVADTVTGEATWGRIAVAGDAVYWVNEGAGSVWTTAKDGSAPLAAKLVAGPGGSYHGVAADDTHVYWADLGAQRVMRLARDDIGTGAVAEQFADTSAMVTEIAVHDGRVFWIDDGMVRVRDTDGGAPGVIGSSSCGRDLAFDVDFVYWTSDSDGAIYRGSRAAEDAAEVVVQQDAPIKHLVAGCDALFFTNFDDGSAGWIGKVAK